MDISRMIRGAALPMTAIVVMAGLPAAAQTGQGSEAEVTFDLGGGTLANALRAFSEQSGIVLHYADEVVAGRTAPAVAGRLPPEAALQMLLSGSGLELTGGPAGSLVVREQKQPRSGDDGGGAAQPAPAAVHAPVERGTGLADEADTLRIERVLVTGTSLRGFAPESSPLQVYTREDIDRSGVTTTEQFIRTLPQNFGGGSTEFAPVGLPNDINSRQNFTYGSGANLRGLGSRGTLVLLNGNRLAPASGIGDFVDLSMIPVSAIDRVDVLTDGASSIYGGDAVAGVINFVLRDDFEGAETALRYGSVTQGQMNEYRLSQTAGVSWDSGAVLGTYEYFDRGALRLSDRPHLAAPELLGGDPITVRRQVI